MNTFALPRWLRFVPTAHSSCAAALPLHDLWSARLNTGESVRCERGVLWLTQSGDATDYLLRAGQSFTATRRARVVVQAMEESLFCVEKAK